MKKKSAILLFRKNDSKIYLNHFVFNIPLFIIYCLFFDYQGIGKFLFFICSLVQLLGNVYIFSRLQVKALSFPSIFLALSYLFHFGHIILYAFNLSFGNKGLSALWYYDIDIYNQTLIFVYLVLYFLSLGFIVTLSRFHDTNNLNHAKIKEESNYKIIILGWIFILIGIIPTISIEYLKLSTFIQSGYNELFNLNIRDYVQVIANCINFGFIALLVGYSDKSKKKANLVFFFAVCFKCFQMVSGGRGESLAFILTFFLIWVSLIHKMKIKEFIAFFIIGFLSLFLISFIANFRISDISLSSFIETFKLTLQYNPIISVIAEFGSTLTTVCFTMVSIGLTKNFSYGINYIAPILYVFPNIGGFNEKIVDSSVFIRHIEKFDQPMGGSYIGELFYSFGWLGVLFAFLIGVLVAFIFLGLKKNKELNNKFKYVLYAQTIPYFFIWIRGYFGGMYRGIIWHSMLAVLIWKMINHYEHLKKEGKVI